MSAVRQTVRCDSCKIVADNFVRKGLELPPGWAALAMCQNYADVDAFDLCERCANELRNDLSTKE